LRRAENVFAFERQRDGLRLDRRWGCEFHAREGMKQFGRQAEIVENGISHGDMSFKTELEAEPVAFANRFSSLSDQTSWSFSFENPAPPRAVFKPGETGRGVCESDGKLAPSDRKTI